jgi:hypothetical protein
MPFTNLAASAVLWLTTGRIVRHDGDVYVVEISTQRQGAPASPVKTLSLRLGEAQTVDSVPVASSPCGVQQVRLDVAVIPDGQGGISSALVPRASGPAAGPRGGGGGGRSTGLRATGASGSGAAGNDSSESLQLLRAIVSDEPTSSNTATNQPTTVHLTPVSASYRGFVWFVRTGGDGSQATVQSLVRIDGLAGQTFSSTPNLRGSRLSVDVTIGLYPMKKDDGTPMLRVVIARVIRDPSQPERFWPGSTDRAIPMPRPNEVISFALPPMSGENLVGDERFELRIQLTPPDR